MRKIGTKAACLLLSGAIGIGGLGLFPQTPIAAASAKSSGPVYDKKIPQIIAKVSPSVVMIVGEVPSDLLEGEYSEESGIDQEGDNLAHGSGVIIRSNGWIVTNAHVVEEMENIRVVTAEGRTYKVREVYSDPISDIALIRINVTGFKPAKFVSAKEKTLVGDPVIAIGTPVSFSLRNSATVGIISGLNRVVGEAEYRLIQTDATINPGNSGGPLLNMRGEILGINSIKYAAIDIDNTGFTIPAATVQYIVNQLFTHGKVLRAGLGLHLEESFSATVGLPSEDPLTVNEVLSNSARKAGVQQGDVLYSVAGKRITTLVDLNELLKSYVPGQAVRVLMQSGGDILERRIVLTNESEEEEQ